MANLVVAQEAVDHFSGYRVLGVLGHGSLGKLYVAEQTGVGGPLRIVALRILDRRLSENPNLQNSILGSARTATKLDHSSIIATYELGQFKGQHFVVMEYLPGESVGSILATSDSHGLMSPEVAAVLAQQCAEGLRYAHRACESHGTNLGLVHREISPAKVFVTYQGNAKLLGFGVATIAAKVRSVPGFSRESFAYTAPEELAGGGADARSDLFSLGVIFWECLTGRHLFGAETPAKTMDAVRSRYVEPPSVFRAEVPPALDEIALRAVSRDPRRRYQTAEEMSRALQIALSGLDRVPGKDDIAAWLKRLFGEERASLKTHIARATSADAVSAELRMLAELVGDIPADSIDEAASEPPHWGRPPEASASREPRPVGRMAPTRLPPPSAHSEPVPAPASSPPPGEDSGPSVTERSEQPAAALGGAAAVEPAPMSLPATATKPRSRLLAIAGVVAGLGAVGVLMFFLSRDDGGDPGSRQKAVTASVGAFQVQSTPSGGQVLIDGDPSGFATPARIGGLRAGQKVEVRVDKAGYKSARQTVEVPAGGPRLLTFVLEESVGKIRLEGVPPRATIYVDDSSVGGKQPLSLSLGLHRLRIEVSGHLVASQSINVRPGEQTIRISVASE